MFWTLIGPPGAAGFAQGLGDQSYTALNGSLKLLGSSVSGQPCSERWQVSTQVLATGFEIYAPAHVIQNCSFAFPAPASLPSLQAIRHCAVRVYLDPSFSPLRELGPGR